MFEQLKQPKLIGLFGFIAGIFIGLVILGWWLWPVRWVNVEPEHLHHDARLDYLRMSIESFNLNSDIASARVRFESLGDTRNDLFKEIQEDPVNLTPNMISSFASVIGSPIEEVSEGEPTPEGKTPVVERNVPGGWIRSLWPLLCIISVIIGAGLIVALVLRNRRSDQSTPEGTYYQDVVEEEPEIEYQPIPEITPSERDVPIAQFMTSYQVGDDLYDDSFTIDSPGGEFLGECGVGISETIGVGEPKRASAFDIWLFDKDDIQTVTKVVMSEHVFADAGLRQRLATKGEPVLAIPGSEMIIETDTLMMVARIVDMAYGEAPLPENSYFERFILDLTILRKS